MITVPVHPWPHPMLLVLPVLFGRLVLVQLTLVFELKLKIMPMPFPAPVLTGHMAESMPINQWGDQHRRRPQHLHRVLHPHLCHQRHLHLAQVLHHRLRQVRFHHQSCTFPTFRCGSQSLFGSATFTPKLLF